MAERAVATSRDTLVEALYKYGVSYGPELTDKLIDTDVIRIVDPADPELHDRVASAIPFRRYTACPHPVQTRWEDARAIIKAVFGDQ